MAYLFNPLGQVEMRRLAHSRLAHNGFVPSMANLPPAAWSYLEESTLRQLELEQQNEHHEHSRLQLDLAVNQCRELYDFAPVPMISLCPQGSINRINLAGARCLGQERTRLLGQDFGAFLTANDLENFRSAVAGTALAHDIRRCTISLEKVGMSPSHWLVSLIATVEGGDVLAVLVDVTEHRQAEEPCGRGINRWKQTIEAGGVGVWDWNVQTGQFNHSAAFGHLFGYTGDASQLTLGQLRGLVHPDDRAPLLQGIQQHLQGLSDAIVHSYRIQHCSGAWRNVGLCGSVTQRGPGGEVQRVAGMMVAVAENHR